MRNIEKAILTFLQTHDIWLTPNNIAKNVGYSSGYVRDTCKELLQAGYIEIDEGAGDPFYRITDAGRDYLENQDS